MGYHRHSGVAVALLFASASCMPAVSQKFATTYHFDIPAQPLKYALRSATRTAGLDLSAASADLSDKTSRGLTGDMPIQQALDELLSDSGLSARIEGSSVFIQGRSRETGGSNIAIGTPSDIVVTGSHISGAAPASFVIRETQQGMIDAGYSNLADAIRTIPQNFNGGQSPGIGGNVPQASGENVGGGSSIDLRGIGQDATLTLLNGRRVAYGGYRQSTDVSSIPFLAVDRIEIVPDGASAIYGSDAVAGVANIILKPDFSGLTTLARLGASTDGGNQQQQYSAIGGKRWGSGGLLVAYDFERDTAVQASERDYARDLNPGLTLYPALKHHSALLNVHQDLSSAVTFELYALYNQRWDSQHYSIDGLATSPSYHQFARSKSFAISPSLTVKPSADWRIVANGSIGLDRLHYGTAQVFQGQSLDLAASCFCNQAYSVEVGADGPLLRLPAGLVRTAIGGGYRQNRLHSFDTVGSDRNINVHQNDAFLYGEISVPIVSPDQLGFAGQRLSLNAAFRYENYPGIDHVTTPKFGITYEPVRGLDLKASWGRSFKAPTLYQLFNSQFATVYSASDFTAGAPTGATVIQLNGGNPALKPERAETWSVTLEVHPEILAGFHPVVSVFHIRYRNRIVSPFDGSTGALSDPRYADFITLDPTAGQAADAIAGRTFFDLSDSGYDPSNVYAIIDDRNHNVAAQLIKGVDLSLSHRLGDTAVGIFEPQIEASYLQSSQRVVAGAGALPLSGTVFNPPKWRGRAGFTWTKRRFTLSSWLNYTGPLHDTRYVPAARISGQVSIDLTASYRPPQYHGALHGLEILGTVRNLTDRAPGKIRSDNAYDPGYDSANYSPLGRVVSLSIRKSW